MSQQPIKALSHVKRDIEVDGDTRPLELRIFRRIFTYAKPYRTNVNWLLLSVGLRSIQGPMLIWALTTVINGPIAGGDTTGLAVGVAAYALLGASTYFVMYFRIYHAHMVGEGIVHDLRNDLFAKFQRMTMGFFTRQRVGRLISRMTSDCESVRSGAQDAVFVSLVNVGTVLVSGGIMAWVDPVLFLIVMTISPVYFLVYHFFRRRLSKAQRTAQESFSRLTGNLVETVLGVRVTQGFARQDVNARLWNDLIADHMQYNMATSRAQGQFTPIVELLGQFVIAVIFIVGGARVLHADPVTAAALATLTLFYFQSTNVLGPVATIGNQYNSAVVAMAGAERVFKLLDAEPDFTDDPAAEDIPPIKGRVEFKGLTFGYDPARPVLHEVNFVAEPGQMIALVGHTGSGKSSIINLISKFYLPTSGELLIDGREIRRIKSESLHRQMGIVLQANFLFTGTVMENIRVGCESATDAQVIATARNLDCLDLIEALPDGFETVVGERGSGLSLGQRQLVCFCRAMLTDPRIMILDEATSSVDTITESRIQKSLAIMLAGRTSFVVAHRLSTIRHASMVLVLDHGRIVERGTHADLLATGGVYSNLYLQFMRAGEA